MKIKRSAKQKKKHQKNWFKKSERKKSKLLDGG